MAPPIKKVKQPYVAQADLIVDDMFYEQPGKTGEVFSYKLHVIIKNIGKARAEGAIVVKVWQTDGTSSPINFKPLLPWAQVFTDLDPGKTAELVWDGISPAAEYCLAVVNLPTLPQYPLGKVKEGPFPSASMNNARGIPGPGAMLRP